MAKLLCDRFLSPDHENHPLTQVADYAISESSLFEVQDFIRELMLPFEPSDSHKLLPSFRWRAIVTTNYDELIEKALERLASLNPTTLACQHGSAYRGDGAALLRELAAILEKELRAELS